MDARLEGEVGSAARAQDSSWTTAVRLRGEFTSGAVAAQELLDIGKADAKDMAIACCEPSRRSQACRIFHIPPDLVVECVRRSLKAS